MKKKLTQEEYKEALHRLVEQIQKGEFKFKKKRKSRKKKESAE